VADDLVADDQWEFWIRQLAVNDVQIGPAHGAGVNFELAPGLGRAPDRKIPQHERMPRLLQDHRAHGFVFHSFSKYVPGKK